MLNQLMLHEKVDPQLFWPLVMSLINNSHKEKE